MRLLLAACLLLAGLSLLLPTQPSYDPFAWLVWGRELANLELDTTGGPSWKPLPALAAALFAPLEGVHQRLPGDLWVAIVRAGGLFAVAMAAKLAAELAGGARAQRVAAGILAAGLLASTPDFLRYMAHGNEVPLALAFAFWAVDRHLHGEHRLALLGASATTLLRPEAALILVPYALWAWRSAPGVRVLAGTLPVAVAALWTVPEWVGSGNPFDAIRQAGSAPSWTLAAEADPLRAVAERLHRLAGLPLELGLACVAVLAYSRRDRALGLVAATLIGWVALVAVSTKFGFSGSPRYFSLPIGGACVLTGMGAAAAAFTPRLLPRLAVTAGIVVCLPTLADRAAMLDRQREAAAGLARMHSALHDTIVGLGGQSVSGPIAVNRVFQTQLAYELDLPLRTVENVRDPSLAFRAGREAHGFPWDVSSLRVVLRVGRWRVLARGGYSPL